MSGKLLRKRRCHRRVFLAPRRRFIGLNQTLESTRNVQSSTAILLAVLALGLLRPVAAQSMQDSIHVEPRILYLSRTDTLLNRVVISSTGNSIWTIDSLTFSRYSPHGWDIELLTKDTVYSFTYAFGYNESVDSFPQILLSGTDTAIVRLVRLDECIVCGLTSKSEGAKAIGDTLRIYYSGKAGGQANVLIDFSLLVSVETVPAREEASLSVFPNPTSGAISMQGFVTRTSLYELKIIDALGRVQLRRSLGLEAGQPLSTRELGILSAAPSGIYFVQLSSPDWSMTRAIVLRK